MSPDPNDLQISQLDADDSFCPTVVKVVLAFWPRVVIAARQTTMIKASMTAYSTAVGPSSRFMNSTVAFQNLRMMVFLSLVPVSTFPGRVISGNQQAGVLAKHWPQRAAR